MIQHPTVSPDGKLTVAVYNSKEGPLVVVSAFGSKDIATIAKLKKSQDRVDSITWVNNERIIISASYSKKMLGDRVRVNRLFAVNTDGSKFKLIQRRIAKSQSAWMDLLSSSRILSLLVKDKEHILLELYDERDKGYAVFKVNVYSNKFEKLFVNKYDVDSWYADNNGQIVFGIGREKDTTTIWHRKDNNDSWKKIHTRKAYDGATFEPILVKNDKAIVISDHKLYRKAVWLYDIKTNEFEKLIYAHDKYDVDNVLLSADKNEVVGATYYDNYQRIHFFENANQKLRQLVKNSFKNYETFIADYSSDYKKVLVLAQRDNTPPKYFWLDLDKKSGGFWFSNYPYLEGKQLANVTPFEFQTPDGMTLNGYLTLPNNIKADEKPPLIIYPHGGPKSRDYQYFNYRVQYFASQGYAVLQVNFRGSEGFGNAYQIKGHRQWGKAMQDDVYAAIDWLATKNLVNTEKSCLVGASYGGYVALTAAFQRPNQFKCIVSIAGIGDLLASVEDDYKYTTLRAFLRTEVGDPKNDADVTSMKKVSAINYVERIKSPILLIHGTHDTRVNYSQSDDFYAEAKSAGVDIEYMKIKKGTHFLDENDNRLDALKTVGEFLQQHLK
jgi:dipeptidyl aminopeptidase/acylaminoacyl peptidase